MSMMIRMNYVKNNYLRFWLIVACIAGFTSVLFFSLIYLNQQVLCDLQCRMRNEVILAIVTLSLFGLFVGSLTYYLISERSEEKLKEIHRDNRIMLSLLEPDEKKIIEAIIDNKGKSSQSDIVKKTGISRVKVSRILKKIEQKGIIKKSQNGMTNIVELEKEIKELFLS